MATGNGGSGQDIMFKLLSHVEKAKGDIDKLQTRMGAVEVATAGVLEQTKRLASKVEDLSSSVKDTKAGVDALHFSFGLVAESLAQLGSHMEAVQGVNDGRLREMEEKVKRLEAVESRLETRLEKLERKAG